MHGAMMSWTPLQRPAKTALAGWEPRYVTLLWQFGCWRQDLCSAWLGHSSSDLSWHAWQIVDSLDTLWLMGMKADYKKARDWVADVLDFRMCALISCAQPVRTVCLCRSQPHNPDYSPPRRDHYSSVFETTIRVLGGLMAAHDLTGDAMYVTRCVHARGWAQFELTLSASGKAD